MNQPHFQTDFFQGAYIGAERSAGADAAHARQFTGTGLAVALGTDAAGPVHAFSRLSAQSFHIHADFPPGLRCE